MNSLFKIVCDASNTALLLIHKEGFGFEYVNDVAQEILVIDRQSGLSALRFEQLFPKSEIVGLRSLSPFILAINGFNDEVFMHRFDGSGFIANMTIKTVSDAGKNYYMISFRDVTADKKMQRELLTKQDELHKTYEDLLRQNRDLAQLDKMKDRFIALTTHELRTPAAAILATADLLDQGLFDTEQELREYIKTVLEQSQHLLDIVNDILDFSKIQAGKLEFYVGSHDISEVIEVVTTNLEQMATENNVTLKFKKNGRAPCYFDSLRMNQVLMNITSNAIKFNRSGGSVEIWTEPKDDSIFVYVKDQGLGIPKEKSASVFNEFETVGNIDTHHKGTGLGMPISKRLMNTMGGEIGFDSQINVGTTFYIRVPVQKVLSDDMYRDRPRRDEAA